MINWSIFANGKGLLEKARKDIESLLSILNAEKAVADPFRALNCAGFSVDLKAAGDFAAPIVKLSKE